MTDEIKREIEIKEFECPFCGFKKSVTVQDTIFNEQTGETMGYGMDYWECSGCGAENDMGLESFVEELEVFRQFTDKDDWQGLYEFCRNNDHDEWMVAMLADLYNQQRQFTKAINLAKFLLRLNANDHDSGFIIKYAEIGIKNGREI